MKHLRTIRITLAAIFLISATTYVILGHNAGAVGDLSARAQIVPSMISVSLGATLFWIAVTLLAGRIYCSTACPLGTLADLAASMRAKIPGATKFYHYKPTAKTRNHILIIYAVCVIAGISIVPLLIEPWQMIRNITTPGYDCSNADRWISLGLGSATGFITGAVTLIAVLVWSALRGRDFCNTVCPIGTLLGYAHSISIYHIEINPDKCINCMKCEEQCKASCVKVVSRFVDNSRCTRCMDCLHLCPNDAIRLQKNRNRRATPLMRRTTRNTT